MAKVIPLNPSGGGVAGVSAVTATAPVHSSGGATPNITIDPATPVSAGSMSGPDKAKLDALPANPVLGVGAVAPVHSSGGQTPQISMDPASAVDDGYMTAALFNKLAGIEPGAQVSRLRQTAFANLTVDQTMNSAAYVALNLAQAITTALGGKLLIDFTCSADSDAALGTPISFEIRLDGVRLGCCSGFYRVGARQSAAFTFETGVLAPGAHTVDVRWKRGAAAGNCHVRPVTQGDWEQASLRLQEVGA